MISLGLPTGSIVPPHHEETMNEKFHVWVKSIQICQTCSQLVSTVNESLKLSEKMAKAIGTGLPKVTKR